MTRLTSMLFLYPVEVRLVEEGPRRATSVTPPAALERADHDLRRWQEEEGSV